MTEVFPYPFTKLRIERQIQSYTERTDLSDLFDVSLASAVSRGSVMRVDWRLSCCV